jgi:LysM repeat protein
MYAANGGGPGSAFSQGKIYVSLDSGKTWNVTMSPYLEWQGLDCDATGQLVSAVAFVGQVYESPDYGMTWIAQNITITSTIVYSDDEISNNSSSDSLSAGSIAGIVVGSVALLVLIALLIAVFVFGVNLHCFPRSEPMAELEKSIV